MKLAVGALGILLCLASVASAEGHATLRRYDVGFFQRFAPQNARDIIDNVPGFRLVERSGDRGLGQAGANVLIDGQRVVGKNIGVTDVLAQIPAAAVREVQVLDGARLHITGFSGLVVNLVLVERGISGPSDWTPEFPSRIPATLSDGDLSVAVSTPLSTLTVRAGNDASRRGSAGPEVVVDPSGMVVQRREKNFESRGDTPFLALAYERKSLGGSGISLRGELERPRLRFRETSLRIPEDGAGPFLQEFEGEFEGLNAEGSGEFETSLGAWGMTLIGLYRSETGEDRSTIDRGLDGASRFSRFLQDSTLTEAVGRAEFSRSLGDKLIGEIGFEYVRNEIGVENRFAEGGMPEETGLAGLLPQETAVAEDRFDLVFTAQYDPVPALSLQSSFALEHSTLSQTQPLRVERRFLRPKGYLRAAYKAGPRTTWRAGVERDVGQIDFFDFATGFDLQEEETDFGNADLVPAIISASDLTYDSKLGEKSRLGLRGFVEIVEDTIDQIPLRDQTGFPIGNAIGNAGRSTAYGMEADATLFLMPLSLPGAQLTLEGEWRDSDIEDPLTFRGRPVSGALEWSYEVTMRHDIGATPYAYGFYLANFAFFEEFRFAQEALFERSHPYANLFAEHKDLFGLRVVATLANVTDVDEEFRRTFFPGARSETLPLFTEIRARNFEPFLNLRITGTF
jgi:hypothetical protein